MVRPPPNCTEDIILVNEIISIIQIIHETQECHTHEPMCRVAQTSRGSDKDHERAAPEARNPKPQCDTPEPMCCVA